MIRLPNTSDLTKASSSNGDAMRHCLVPAPSFQNVGHHGDVLCRCRDLRWVILLLAASALGGQASVFCCFSVDPWPRDSRISSLPAVILVRAEQNRPPPSTQAAGTSLFFPLPVFLMVRCDSRSLLALPSDKPAKTSLSAPHYHVHLSVEREVYGQATLVV